MRLIRYALVGILFLVIFYSMVLDVAYAVKGTIKEILGELGQTAFEQFLSELFFGNDKERAEFIENVEQGRFDDAHKYIDNVLEANPQKVAGLAVKGLLFSLEGDSEQANSYFDEVLKIDPNNLYVLTLKGYSILKEGNLEEASFYFDTVLDIDPNNKEALFFKAEILNSQGNSEDALEYLERAVEQDPTEPIMLSYKAMILSDLGKCKSAIESVNKALKTQPDSEHALLATGIVLKENGYCEMGDSYIDRTRSINPYFVDSFLSGSLICGSVTASSDEICDVSVLSQNIDNGGCLIATATYGSELAPQVQFLREIRDNTVLSTTYGTSFMTAFNSFYYSFSPAVADLERQNPIFKETVKVAITPLLSSLSLLQYADIDSETEMLGYGISIILLNIGMYFVAPVIVILKIKSRFGQVYK